MCKLPSKVPQVRQTHTHTHLSEKNVRVFFLTRPGRVSASRRQSKSAVQCACVSCFLDLDFFTSYLSGYKKKKKFKKKPREFKKQKESYFRTNRRRSNSRRARGGAARGGTRASATRAGPGRLRTYLESIFEDPEVYRKVSFNTLENPFALGMKKAPFKFENTQGSFPWMKHTLFILKFNAVQTCPWRGRRASSRGRVAWGSVAPGSRVALKFSQVPFS